MRSRFAVGLAVVAGCALFAACSSKSTQSSFGPPGQPPGGDDQGDGGTNGGGGGGGGGGAFFNGDGGGGGGGGPSQDAAAATVAVVYAHSPDTLYELDPTTKAVTVVGPFTGGCTNVIDLALDENSHAWVTTFTGFYGLDVKTAACTHIADGNYPNSLSFVPKGTLDPNQEALVGYFGSTYVRIDETTGNITNVGALSQGYQSSGDIVSVIGGGTFLTVNGNNCSDCLLQVDPATGDLVQNYGSVNHGSVFGIAFWAGTVYGFDDAGEIFSIDYSGGSLVTTNIPVPNPPPGLEFWGAGSTTTAPPQGADGGGIPIR
jgi:hypothetical protein